jgi:hypothetical protein
VYSVESQPEFQSNMAPSSGLKSKPCKKLEYSRQHSSSKLKIEAICSSELSFDFYQTSWRYISEGRTVDNHRFENMKSYNLTAFFRGS